MNQAQRNESLKSEEVILSAPMSFTGSTKRIWKMTKTDNNAMKILLVSTAIILLITTWSFVLVWYVVFGIFLIPYRLLRRGSRKKKRDDLRHREMLQAIQQ